MFAPHSAQVNRSARRFNPTLETLEERHMPAVTPLFNPATGVLTLTGSNAADAITVLDSGQTTTGGTVQVFSGLSIFPAFTTPSGTTVRQININTLNGADSVVYSVTGSAIGEQRLVSANLGAGNDAFTALAMNGLARGTNWRIDVFGQAGRDALAAVISGQLAGAAGGQAGATLNVNYFGGAGADAISMNALSNTNVQQGATLGLTAVGGLDRDSLTINYAGELDGTLRIESNGGAGRDALTSAITLQAGSTGTLFARLFGAADRDALTLNVVQVNPADPVTVDALINGGPGRDNCSHTANVTTVNCP